LPGRLWKDDNLFLLVGLDFGKYVHFSHLIHQRVSAYLCDLRAGQDFGAGKSQLLADGFGNQTVISGYDFKGNAQLS
jgi:hypothetical protein